MEDDLARYFTVDELAVIEQAAYRGQGASAATTLRLIERLRINRSELLRMEEANLRDPAACPFDCDVCRVGSEEDD